MKRFLSLAALVCVVAWAAAAPAPSPDTVTIKLRENTEGDVIQVEKTEGGTLVTKINLQGMATEDSRKVGEMSSFKETIVKVDGKKKPLKIEREYARAEKIEGGNATKLPYDGKTVVIEQIDGNYTFKIKGGEELTGADAASLNSEFNKQHNDSIDRLLMPKNAVKVGDEWKIDMKEVARQFGGGNEVELDGEKATGSGKLLKVYTKDGKQFGEIQIKLEMPIKSIGQAPASFEAGQGSKMTLTGTLDACIDGTSHAGTMKAKVKVNLSAMPMGTSIEVAADIDSTTTQKDVKK
jgi:hypothetical protein